MPKCPNCKTEVESFKDHKTGKEAFIEVEKHPFGNIVVSREKGLFRLATEMEYERSRTSDTGSKLWVRHDGRCQPIKPARKRQQK